MDSEDSKGEIKINATLNLTFEGKSTDENAILTLVRQKTHFLIKYDHSDYVHSPDKDEKAYELKPSKGFEKINRGVTSNHNVYFIFDSNNLNILYVGKSQSIRSRLKNHLIKCSENTSSKIQNIQKYLKDAPIKRLYYYSIEVCETKYYGAIEGTLIAYIKNHENDFPNNWNDRED